MTLSVAIPDMKISDDEIVQAAISAAQGSRTGNIDLKDIYLELLNCTAYSKLYRFRFDIVSRQRMINIILTNGFRVVDSRKACKVYGYDPNWVDPRN